LAQNSHIKQGSVEERFDKRFGDNEVYWEELIAEIRIGDPDFNSLKTFINSEITTAVQKALERQKQSTLEEIDALTETIRGTDYVETKLLKDFIHPNEE